MVCVSTILTLSTRERVLYMVDDGLNSSLPRVGEWTYSCSVLPWTRLFVRLNFLFNSIDLYRPFFALIVFEQSLDVSTGVINLPSTCRMSGSRSIFYRLLRMPPSVLWLVRLVCLLLENSQLRQVELPVTVVVDKPVPMPSLFCYRMPFLF